jgi:hypothetical protein
MSTQTTTTTILNTDLVIKKTEHYDAQVLDAILHDTNFLAKYLRALKKEYHDERVSSGFKDVIYEYPEKYRPHQIGRLYVRHYGGLQPFPHDIRNPLLATYNWDIDMENAHYWLLLKLAKDWNLPSTHIEKYVNNRNEELAKVSHLRKEAKTMFLKALYGGDVTLYKEDYLDTPEKPLDDTLLVAISKEVVALAEACYSRVPGAWKRLAKKTNTKCSVLSLYLQTEECKCLLKLDEYMKTQNRNVSVLIHDGCAIEKKDNEPAFPEPLLRGAEAYIKETTGHVIRLVAKEFEHNYTIVKDEHLVPKEDLVDDLYAAKEFVKLMGPHLIYDSKVVWIYNDQTGLWTNDQTALKRVITKMNGKLVFKQEGPVGIKIYDYSGSVEKREKMIKMISSAADERDGYMRSRKHTDIGKLLWADGIYDFKTKTFTEGFNHEIFFTARIPRNYPRERNEDIINFVQEKTFTNPFLGTGDGELFKHELMRMIYGDYYRKKAFIGQGPWNSSKGVSTDLLQTAFGTFVETFNGNSLLFKSYSGESERDMTFAIKICNSRIAISSEIRMPHSSAGKETRAVIDANTLKTLVSGGDEFQARDMYEKASKFVNKAAIMMFLNDTPEFSPATANEQQKIKVISFSASFTDNPVEVNERLWDTTLKEKYRQTEYGDALFHILVEEYEKWEANGFTEMDMTPTGKASLEMIVPVRKMAEVLREGFEITKCSLDMVPFQELLDYLRSKKVQGSDNKIARDLTNLGLGSCIRKDKGDKVTFRTGLKPIQ